jgi:hypothetical protein
MTASVGAPPVWSPRFGLVAASEAAGADRWDALGLSWAPPQCDTNGAAIDWCNPSSLTIPAAPAKESASAFVVWEGVKWSTFGGCDPLEAAKERLLQRQSFQVEQELWYGTRTQAESWANGYLTDGNRTEINTGTKTPLFTGIAHLQYELLQKSQRGFIHLTSRALSAWELNAPGSVRVVGDHLEDIYGNYIIPGAGYGLGTASGDTGDEGESWAFATGPVVVHLGEISAVEAVDQTNNVKTAIASRMAIAYFNPCVQVGVHLDHCVLNCT